MKKGIWALKTNESKEKQGVWIEHPDMDARFLLRRAGGANTAFENAQLQATRPWFALLDNNKKSPDVKIVEKIAEETAKVYSEHIVVGWEGSDICDSETGEPLAYSKEDALKILRDLPNIFKWVRQHAMDESNFRDSLLDLETESKNS